MGGEATEEDPAWPLPSGSKSSTSALAISVHADRLREVAELHVNGNDEAHGPHGPPSLSDRTFASERIPATFKAVM